MILKNILCVGFITLLLVENSLNYNKINVVKTTLTSSNSNVTVLKSPNLIHEPSFVALNSSPIIKNITKSDDYEYILTDSSFTKLLKKENIEAVNDVKNKTSSSAANQIKKDTNEVEMEEIEHYTLFNEGENETFVTDTTIMFSTDNYSMTESTDATSENVTEIMDIVTTPIEPTKPPKKKKKSKSLRKSHSQTKGLSCHCDLTLSICDVNCCCDKDCSDIDKGVFTLCEEETEIVKSDYRNTRYCTTKEYVYRNNSPWLIETKSSNLFCVIKDNLPPKLERNDQKVITSNEELTKQSNNHFSWPDEQISQEYIFDNTKPYVYGDNIWILINSSLQLLSAPSSNFNMYCSKRTNLKYLMNQKTKCIISLRDMEIYNLYSNYQNMYLISSPMAMNDTWLNNTLECPANVCIPLTAYICNNNNCSLLNNTETNSLQYCLENTCINMMTSVKFHFLSNGTAGYTNASVIFGLRNVTLTSIYIEQEFEIEQAFVSKNTSIISRALSGNPGYLTGKPVIISRIAKNEENDTKTSTMDYFSSTNLYPLRNILAFPQNLEGYCIFSNVSYITVNFKENVKFNCKIKLNVSESLKSDNATMACVDLQNNFMPYSLKDNNQMIHVSTAGNPSTDLKSWIELLHEYSPNLIKGSFMKEKTVLKCENLISREKYTFTYSNIQQANMQTETYLVGAGVKYISEELEFEIRDNITWGKLIMTTRFVDITKPQPLEYARGPNFQIHLPEDFFYPFSLNHCSHCHQMHEVIFVTMVLMFMLIL